MFKKSKTKAVRLETSEEAIARGVTIEHCECIMPNSLVYPDKYGMQRRKRRSKYKSESKKVNVEELLSKCSPEQKAKLTTILKKQGIKV